MMQELLNSLTLSMDQLLRIYAPIGLGYAQKAIQEIDNTEQVFECLKRVRNLRLILQTAASTTDALIEEISRIALISTISGELDKITEE